MRYKLLGSSGLRVAEVALGTMTFGETWGWGADKATSQAIFDTYADAGGNFIDTANIYTDGVSEEFVGEFIANDRDYFVVATKYSLTDIRSQSSNPNHGGNNRKNMMHTVEGSLRRMNTDYIDLLWLHAWDFTTPVEEVLRGMDDLVRQGKVLYIGFSDTPAWVISRAVTLAEQRGWIRPAAVQLPYSLVRRDPERELLPMARALDLAVTPWGTLGGGVLTGKYTSGGSEPTRYSADDVNPADLAAAEAVGRIAEAIGASPSQVAINWIRQQPGILIPIIGARKVEQITDNLGALDFELTAEQMQELNSLSDFSLGFPRSFLESDNVRSLIFGQMYDRIDNHRA
ncbi:MAG: aldo/keto reductase [Chloroflexi bacterium]|nr:aldo/keto reductase [Chloroflexota bacterium]